MEIVRHITKDQFLKIRSLLDKKGELNEKVILNFQIRTAQELENSRNKAYKLLVP